MRKLEAAVLGAALSMFCSFVLLAAAHARAEESVERQFDISPQSLAAALSEFARQSQQEILFAPEIVARKRSPELRGNLEPLAALQLLLKDSGLEFTTTPGGAILIGAPAVKPAEPSRRSEDAQPDTPKESSAHSFWDRFRLAQTDRPAAASEGSAQESQTAAPNESLSEIVVTAQKRAERLQEVPISISVLRGEQLDSSTAQGMLEVLNRTPGVAIYGSDRPLLSIRGVSAGSVTASAGSNPVSYYLDTVPFGLARTAIVPDVETYDLERVEVLRGPQGTLYGANAQTGVIRILTKSPDLSELELKARTAFSSTEDGGENFRGDAAINVPLIEGKLAFRGALSYQDLGGWIDKANDEDANDAEARTARFKIGARPTDSLWIDLSAWLSRIDQGAPPNSSADRSHASVIDEPVTNDYDVYGLKIEQEFSAFSVSSMTGYLDYEHVDVRDLAPTLLGALPVTLLNTILDADTFSQELVFTAAPDALWRWTLGGMYRDSEDRIRQNSLAGGIPFDYAQGSESYAVFGEVGRRFLGDELGVTLGLRYFHDETFVKENISQGPPGSAPINASASFSATTPRAVLTWYPSDTLTLYGSYSQGFRSGFPQNPGVVRAFPGLVPLDPDKLHNYEVGLKTILLDGRFELDSAAFYIDWRGTQQSLAVAAGGTFVAAQVNSQSASGPGFEFALTVRPTDRLELGASFGWNDLTFDADVVSRGIVLFPDGGRLAGSPEHTASLSADYRMPVGSDGYEGRLSFSGNHVSSLTDRFLLGTALLTSEGDSMLITRASVGIESQDRWAASLFVDNLNDEDGASVTSVLSPAFSTRVRPRTIGLQIDFSF